MPDPTAPVLRVDPEKLGVLAEAHEDAAHRVSRIVDDLAQRGRIDVPWMADKVSVEMAAHYNAQVFDGEYCTYAALKRYETELRAVADALRQMRADYETAENEAAAALRRPMGGA
jgi:hypothetical protein